MLQEKQNNGLKGMDELTEIPGESSLDKSLFWQKLESRLEPKKPSKAIWYWAAAACLLIALSIPFFSKKDKAIVTDVAVTPIHKTETPINAPEKISPQENTIITIHTAAVVEKQKEIIVLKKQTALIHSLPVEKIIIPEQKIVEPQNPVIANNIITKPDTNVLVKNAPVKMRVVHNNELEDEDRFANQKIRNNNSRNNKAANEAYTGVLNFNIHLNN